MRSIQFCVGLQIREEKVAANRSADNVVIETLYLRECDTVAIWRHLGNAAKSRMLRSTVHFCQIGPTPMIETF